MEQSKIIDTTETYHITFRTNLTGGPAHIALLLFVSVFRSKEYQTESKRNETFRSVIFGKDMIRETWSSSQGRLEEARR